MFFKSKNKQNKVLSREPYASFLKKYNERTNKEIHVRIDSVKNNECLKADNTYAQFYDLSFKFYNILKVGLNQIPMFYVKHSISYSFYYDSDYWDIMMDVIEDIQKKSVGIYISSLVKKCRLECFIKKNLVTITYYVVCDRKNAKEICLQLISHDIAMFARGF